MFQDELHKNTRKAFIMKDSMGDPRQSIKDSYVNHNK